MTNNNEQASILWHDYETWGVSPKYDKPSQFAAIRTDLDLNIIGEPQVFYCKPPADYLPQPEACLVTGITPQKALAEGVCEAEFADRIHALFSQPNTCVAGYNSIRFDDEVSRYLFFRNFYDPYAREWQNNNSRWDIIDLVRACYALRPEGINWPENDDGLPTFKLELLTKANGIEHTAAHDAMSDVYATIAMAKLIKEKQPKLYDFIFSIRNKRKVAELIDVYNMTPVVHTSSKVSSAHGCTSWFAPISYHPTNKNAVIAVDLARDISPLLTLTPDEIETRLYTPYAELAEGELPIPVKLIHLNKCPVIAPAKTLLPENAQRLDIPRERCLQNLSVLKQNPHLREVLSDVFSKPFESELVDDSEHSLYSGSFFSENDKAQMALVKSTAPEKLGSHQFMFSDNRLHKLLFLYRARNFPLSLTTDEQHRWQQHCQNKLQFGQHGLLSLQEYMIKIEHLAGEYEHSPDKIAILKALYMYAQQAH